MAAKTTALRWAVLSANGFCCGVTNEPDTPRFKANSEKVWRKMPRRWHGLMVVDGAYHCLTGLNRILIGTCPKNGSGSRLEAVVNPNAYCKKVWREVRKNGR